ncbi:hypothetical protein DU508_22435 [Pedobacter chinensis]|uniref:Uncharacterized protein n=1 Tax=Pedobacter chinensis TaxID=2282421 RepID=A0A369PVV3_9SPHI|nr:hypothetical protein [Pedobacter chinensis]RDC54248.1 hypothetical protein DU508_22435 [Pedobacter chinensis]
MIKFYLTLLLELALAPLLYPLNSLKNHLGKNDKGKQALRAKPIADEIIYAIHEWAGYPPIRKKKIAYVNKEFTCGLRFQLQRIYAYKGQRSIRKILTVSDYNTQYFTSLKETERIDEALEIYPVENKAMDFSGYAYVCHNLIDWNKEQAIFLTNSSVNCQIDHFIDDYVDLLVKYKNIGLIGVSYSTKIYQSLIKNNFNPHLQSFFLLTTTSVLKELLAINNGLFPGENESYKASIIRFGEIKLSKLVQSLGYDIAFVSEDGNLNLFPKKNWLFNGYQKWKLPHGDYRLWNVHPNKIYKYEKAYQTIG